MKKPPKVRLLTAEPLQDYYRDGDGGLFSVARLLVKAIALGRTTIKARRMTWKPEPCRAEA